MEMPLLDAFLVAIASTVGESVKLMVFLSLMVQPAQLLHENGMVTVALYPELIGLMCINAV